MSICRLHGLNAVDELRPAGGQAASEHAAGDDHPAEIAGPELLAEEVLGAGLDPLDGVDGEVALVEQNHEHAMGTVFARRAGLARRRGARRVVRDHVELLDRLRLPVFEQREILREQPRDEPAAAIEHDDVDFDEVGRGTKRRLLRAGLGWGILALQGQRAREPHEREGNGATPRETGDAVH